LYFVIVDLNMTYSLSVVTDSRARS